MKAAFTRDGSAHGRDGLLGVRACDLAVYRGAADREQFGQLSDGVLSGAVQFEQDRPLGAAELGCLAFESAFGAGDRHAFAGAHSQEVDLELSEGREDVEKHLPIGSLGSSTEPPSDSRTPRAARESPIARASGTERARRSSLRTGVGDLSVQLGRWTLMQIRVRGTADRGPDQRESGHSVGMRESEIDGRLTTHRAGHHDRSLQARVVENRDRVADRRPAVLALVHRLTVTSRVKRNTPMARTQPLDDVLPTTSIVDAGMNQQSVSAIRDARALVGNLGES